MSYLDQGDRVAATALEISHENFVGQCSSIVTLIDATSSHCSTCRKPYSVQSWTHSGHVLSVGLECVKKHSLKWCSSSTIKDCELELNSGGEWKPVQLIDHKRGDMGEFRKVSNQSGSSI